MKRLIPFVAAFAMSLAGAAQADPSPVVVELFTSQGCSSCPPADKLLHELALRDDVIALALHVDYWDYIGWKDPFGKSEHADRQRAYAAAAGRRTIYTPEMVVQGQSDIVGAKPMKLAKAIAEHARAADKVSLTVQSDTASLTIKAEAMASLDTALVVHLVRYSPKQTTQIKRGENRGKTLDYANVVKSWAVVGQWDGRNQLELVTPMEGELPAVVLIQGENNGPILAAAKIARP